MWCVMNTREYHITCQRKTMHFMGSVDKCTKYENNHIALLQTQAHVPVDGTGNIPLISVNIYQHRPEQINAPGPNQNRSDNFNESIKFDCLIF